MGKWVGMKKLVQVVQATVAWKCGCWTCKSREAGSECAAMVMPTLVRRQHLLRHRCFYRLIAPSRDDGAFTLSCAA
jgi:hypothetical protein